MLLLAAEAASAGTNWWELGAVLLAAAIGAGLGSLGTNLATRSASELEEGRRRTARSEEAAEVLTDLVVEASNLYSWTYGPEGGGPVDDAIVPISDSIRKTSMRLEDAGARASFEKLAVVLVGWEAIAQTETTTAHTIMFRSREEALAIAGAVIRAEAVPASPTINGYYGSLQHFWTTVEGC